jgi:membrane protein implicated in regulation of membrane protease activity
MIGPDAAIGGLLFAGLVVLALGLFVVAIRVGRWAIWLAAYLVAAGTVAAALLQTPAVERDLGSLLQRSDGSGVLTSVEAGIDPRRGDTITEEGQRVHLAILDGGGEPAW